VDRFNRSQGPSVASGGLFLFLATKRSARSEQVLGFLGSHNSAFRPIEQCSGGVEVIAPPLARDGWALPLHRQLIEMRERDRVTVLLQELG